MAMPERRDALHDALDGDVDRAHLSPGPRHPVSETASPLMDRRSHHRGSLWWEEPVGRVRMPDPVRRAAVRAVLIGSLTLISVNIAVLGALAQSWIAAPATLVAVVGTIVATWAVLDVWVTRQVYVQRHGVVSKPSSAARNRRGPRRGRGARARRERARPPVTPTEPGRSGRTTAGQPHPSGSDPRRLTQSPPAVRAPQVRCAAAAVPR